jgi:hypothetical protein
MKKALFFILFFYNCCYSQSFDPKVLEHIDEFFIDAVFYADQFITPATDAAVYQSSGGWIFSAKRGNVGVLLSGYILTFFLFLKATEHLC